MIKYINNHSNKTILFLHGLACNSLYFNDMINLFGNKYNIILPELFGHYENSTTNFTLDEEVEKIIKYCETNNVKIDIIIAHSMSSILAFYLDKILNNIEKIFLLEGNIIDKDFEWSTQISNMKKGEFMEYWKKFKKQYSLILKMKLKNKLDLKIYTQSILELNDLGIYKYAKLISDFKMKMDIFKESFFKTVYFESDTSDLFFTKKLYAKSNNIDIKLINNSSHYMMLDSPKQIVKIINEVCNDS